MAPPQILSLEKQFRFYRFYHTNTVNKRIHMVFVPVLIISFLAVASRLSVPGLSVDLSVVVAGGYFAYAMALDFFIGLCFTPFLLAAYLVSSTFSEYAGAATVPWALTINLAAWVAQFVGHFSFEGNSPAVFDALVTSVLAAPIVIWLEAMFALGFLKETKARLMRSYVASKAKRAVTKADKAT